MVLEVELRGQDLRILILGIQHVAQHACYCRGAEEEPQNPSTNILLHYAPPPLPLPPP